MIQVFNLINQKKNKRIELEPTLRKQVNAKESTINLLEKKEEEFQNPFPQDADDDDFLKSSDEEKSKKSEEEESDDESDDEKLFEEFERIKKEREEEQKKKVKNF